MDCPVHLYFPDVLSDIATCDFIGGSSLNFGANVISEKKKGETTISITDN